MSISPMAKLALLGLLSASAFAAPMQGVYQQQARQWLLSGESSDREVERAPIKLPDGARLESNVAYGSDPMQRMDIYIPLHVKSAPVIFMVHGGGWTRGDKAAYNVVGNKIGYFLPKGYIFISANYRLAPQVGVMTEASDVAHALAYAQQHAAGWGGDPARFVLMGHSAGAHLVTLISSVPAIWRSAGARPWLGSVALDSAAYNVVNIMNGRHFGLYDRVFGNDRELWEEASPTLRLKSAPLPMLLVCSTLRRNSCDQADAFASRANSLGGRVKVAPVAMRHAEINLEVGASASYTGEIDGFLRSLGLN